MMARQMAHHDRGQDACSIFPRGKRVIFTSTRDHTICRSAMVGSEQRPAGCELYVADIDGRIERLTNNMYYRSPRCRSRPMARRCVHRQVEGALDLYMMNIDGSGEKKLTDTPDWQRVRRSSCRTRRPSPPAPGAARSTAQRPTPMTIFTINTETGERIQRTTTTG